MPLAGLYTSANALMIARVADYTPEEDYPGKVKLNWRVRCNKCQQIRTVTLSDLLGGRKRCKHQRPFPNKKLPQMKREYDAGASIRDLAEEYGASYAHMHKRLSSVTTLRQRGGDTRSLKVLRAKRAWRGGRLG